jgi:hypothetical protein
MTVHLKHYFISPVTAFYKRGSQEKCFPGDRKAQEKRSCLPALVI